MRSPRPGGLERLSYRSDLDGLRGIAVSAVVAYHLGLPFASGGFVGVDIFFVLSGFLITRIIASELDAGNFSFVSFYERRIRRIAPTLIFVCACTTALAVAFLLPGELRRYATSLMAVAFSVSNFWCVKVSGYFGPAAETQPLFHTWSLGVEEQFYLLFPLFLSAIAGWPSIRKKAIVWGLFALSLGISIAMLHRRPESTFFLLHTRAWELLTGSIIALRFLPSDVSRAARECAAIAGLAAICAAIVLYNSETPFPGAAALLPCIGAALIIWSGQSETVVAGLLSTRLLVWLGLISYSLYLWHWPLIVFANLQNFAIHTTGLRLALFAVSIGLAALTWRFVEQPFRRRGAGEVSGRGIFLAGGAGLGSLAAVALALFMLRGLPQRYSSDIVAIEAGEHDSSPLRRKCHVNAMNRAYGETCVIGADVAPQIIVYGDSHGAELSAVLGAMAKDRGASVREITASGCPPVADDAAPHSRGCARYNTSILRSLSAMAPATVILAAKSVHWNDNPNSWRGIEKTVSALRADGHRVIVMGPIPDVPGKLPVPTMLARWTAGGNAVADYRFKPDMAELKDAELKLKQIASKNGATFVPVAPMFCSEDSCRPYLDGTIMYFDDNHLSMSGARLIANRLLVPILWPAPNPLRPNASPPSY